MTTKHALAYPFVDHGFLPPERHIGLTKRELFAMAAMQGLCANHFWTERFSKDDVWRRRTGIEATLMADALIEALNNGDGV